MSFERHCTCIATTIFDGLNHHYEILTEFLYHDDGYFQRRF